MLSTAFHRPLPCGAVEEPAHTSVHTCRTWRRSRHTQSRADSYSQEPEAAEGAAAMTALSGGVLPLSPEPGVAGVGLKVLETRHVES